MNKTLTEIEKKFEEKVFRYITGILGQYGKPLEEITELNQATLASDCQKLSRSLINEAIAKVQEQAKKEEAREMVQEIKTEDLIKELENRGYKWGYLSGHGTDEACSWSDGNETWVIADIEKTNVLIKPEDQFKEPIKYNDYF